MANYWIFLVINLVFWLKNIHGDLYSAIVGLEGLIDTENAVIKIMEDYIRVEEQKIDILKRHIDVYQKEHDKAIEDVELYLLHPLNAFALIKRLTADWLQILTLISTDTSNETMVNISFLRNYRNIKFPTNEDLSGAAAGIIRLQHTYKLDTSLLARGEINGLKSSSELTASDCFELGIQCYIIGKYYLATLWMEEAETRLKMEANKTVEYSVLLDYLAWSTYEIGNIPRAINLTYQLLEMVPDHSRARLNIPFYRDKLRNMETIQNTTSTSKVIETQQAPVHNDVHGNYDTLCRGEQTQSAEYKAKLKCRYLSRNNPFLKIGPFKVEEAHLDPELYIFHDVIYDTEIETLKRLGSVRFGRATVRTVGSEAVAADYRVSQVAWLTNDVHPHIADISRRVGDMTGLAMNSEEDLQILNYGIGGHYEPHYDFLLSGTWDNSFKKNGDRIATVLFYLSDVEQGGATVFPNMNSTVWPKKGTAIFWYNLHPSGHKDIRTRHAACPVLVGSKWVSTKWIHESHQEFKRPCTKDLPENNTILI